MSRLKVVLFGSRLCRHRGNHRYGLWQGLAARVEFVSCLFRTFNSTSIAAMFAAALRSRITPLKLPVFVLLDISSRRRSLKLRLAAI